MRSFGLLTLAAAALLPFVSGAPLVDADAVAIAKAGVHARVVDVSANAKADARVHARAIIGVASILADLQINLGDTLCELHHFTAKNATKENITPILTTIVSVVGDSVVDLKALKGKPTATIMASVDGSATVSISVIAQLLANVLCSICLGLNVVLSVISDTKVLVDVIANVALGGCLCGLINAVVAVVGGLLVELVPHVTSLASLLVSLGLTAVGSLLTIC